MSDRPPPERPGSPGGEGPTGDGAGGEGPTEVERALSLRADPRTNAVVKTVLRTGLVLALALLLVGLALQLSSGDHRAVEVRMFDLVAPRPVGERIMAVGVLVLTLTPASGVLSVVLSWVRERDRVYVGVGCLVVVVLAAAVLVGLG